MRALPILLLALAGCQTTQPLTPAEGRDFFAENCASCHGASGTGDGEMAAQLSPAPPDLTTISARHGGSFPRDYVMSMIDGYARGDHFSAAMPQFGDTDLGDTIVVADTRGNGEPVPRKLLLLADYLESIQKR